MFHVDSSFSWNLCRLFLRLLFCCLFLCYMRCYFAWLLMLCLEGNRRRYSCFCFFILFGRFCSWFGWSLLLAFLIGPFSFGLACFFSWKGMRTFVKCRLFGLFYSYLEKIDQSLCFPLNLQYNFSFAHTLSFPQSHAFFPSSSSPEKPFLPASSRTSPSYLHLWYKYHFSIKKSSAKNIIFALLLMDLCGKMENLVGNY